MHSADGIVLSALLHRLGASRLALRRSWAKGSRAHELIPSLAPLLNRISGE